MNEALGDLRWESRTINMSQLGAVLNGSVDPPVKGLFVYNCNPVATVPDQNAVIRGLLRQDLFTVVFDQVLTDSAEYADILLPATTFLEHDDIRISYGTYVVGGATRMRMCLQRWDGT
jgi:anaerobic selenocysteine-containing dehydrogenase